ncbi:Solute carrier family 12 member 8 [Chelonia mydas]|uniref:Solute carrier family 12 member 8 n=1 Tax=Chelonia mydas TaxID=8469 RepID=M7BKF6_CHEMY|nr:Solute carrier family 12 member 8 [Chelonia mydas]
MAFVFVGQVNILAPIVTINFMLTYIAVDYSYFSVSMSYILQQKPKRTQREASRAVNSSQPLTFEKTSRYGSDGIIQSRSDGTLLEFTKDMDQLFKPLNKDPETCKENEERDKNLNQKVKQRKIKKPAKQTLQDSFLLDLDHNIAPAPYCCTKTSEPDDKSLQSFTEQSHQSERNLCLSSAVDTEQKRDHELMEYGEQLFNELQNPPNQKAEDTNVKQQNQEVEIQRMPVSFYSRLCNHWVSLVGAIGSLVIMFVIQWIYTLINLSVAIILYFYIGQMSPGLPPGAAANFSFLSWIKLGLVSSCRTRPSPEEQIVVTPSFATVGMETTQLTEENADFASRDRYHHSSVIRREEFVNQFQ